MKARLILNFALCRDEILEREYVERLLGRNRSVSARVGD